MLSLVRSLSNFRSENPDFANGEIGNILNDMAQWLVFEKQSGNATYLTLINTSDMGYDYRFHDQWYPEYQDARVLFWSNGLSKQWEDMPAEEIRIENSVYVPPFGLVILKKH